MLVDVTDDVADFRDGVAKLRASGLLDNDTWSEVWDLDGLESMLFQRVVLGTPLLGFDPGDEMRRSGDLDYLYRLRVVTPQRAAARTPVVKHDEAWNPYTEFAAVATDTTLLDLRCSFLFDLDDGETNDKVMTVCIAAPEAHAALVGTALVVDVPSATFWLDEPDDALSE